MYIVPCTMYKVHSSYMVRVDYKVHIVSCMCIDIQGAMLYQLYIRIALYLVLVQGSTTLETTLYKYIVLVHSTSYCVRRTMYYVLVHSTSILYT